MKAFTLVLGIALIVLLAFLAWQVLGVGRGGDPARMGACIGVEVAADVLPSVVTVETSTGRGAGNGSGQLVRADGYVLTNYHVVSDAAAAGDAGSVAIRYADGASSPARIVGLDPTTDLGVIQAEDRAPGRPVIAIGTSGIWPSASRSWPSARRSG